MAVSLKKGQGVSLRKEENDLSKVTIGLGWDVAEEKKGFLGKLFSGPAEEFDLDAIAILLGPKGNIQHLGKDENGQPSIAGSDVIFFNSLKHPSGAIWLTGDNRTGDGDGDDEQIIVKLDQIPAIYERIVFIVAIYQGRERKQHFGRISNAFIRAVDAKNKEVCRYDVSVDSSFNNRSALTFAEFVREGANWSFKAIGTPLDSDNLMEIIRPYLFDPT
ncbi:MULTISPECIES: TerD family protein [Undibacterium]|uniref:TerD family protein n=1 Tax=Undibacterium umbellatum TaxID=2762300 RepID=A0ABR6Z7W1_9BURK|nr:MULTISPECIES: TerD family protein [Undibacterium]MBC3907694.1 TerD family protein [Undibacterium umbellatum]MDP1978920.1 TerD family protein [Undibacterium sp.]